MIYLDHNATTQPSESVISVMTEIQRKCWGNPNSVYSLGFKSTKQIKIAENIIKNHINGHEGTIVWTPSGSYANLLAITGICNNHGDLITSAIEHKSIDSIRRKYGNTLTTNPIGRIWIEDLWKRFLNKYVKLVSLIYVNNETGLINDLKIVKYLLKDYNTLFHIDAVQALGKICIDVEELECDLMSLSAHKIYGPKGIGCLWIRNGSKIKIPYLGTPNIPGIIGFGQAVKEININLYFKELQTKEHYFLSELKKTNVDFKLNTTFTAKVPGTLSISFNKINNIELMLELSDKKVYLSTGSACDKGKNISRILTNMNLSNEQISSTVRVSLGKHCSFKDISNGVLLIADTIKEIKNGSKS